MGEPQFSQSRTRFSVTTRVTIDIQAPPETVWGILTRAKDFPRWNSTVTDIEGEIREGEQLRMHTIGTDRAFTPKVSNVVPNERMTWVSGPARIFKGVRTFLLSPRADGSTTFMMEERFSGLMVGLAGGTLPEFKPIFEAYAIDLRDEAERIAA